METGQLAQRSKLDSVAIVASSISCPNPNCRELSLSVALHKYGLSHGDHGSWVVKGGAIQTWQLMPRSRAKPQPAYIPIGIRKDYEEACLILGDSPKASATMSRRCLQGIVRDFWQIPLNKRGNLGAELNLIEEKVAPSTWNAITTIREIGDIGAHMEKDVNYIVEVEADEASMLIELIEMLFQDWYIERQNRLNRDAAVQALAAKKLEEKKEAKKSSKAAVAAPAASPKSSSPSDEQE